MILVVIVLVEFDHNNYDLWRAECWGHMVKMEENSRLAHVADKLFMLHWVKLTKLIL